MFRHFSCTKKGKDEIFIKLNLWDWRKLWYDPFSLCAVGKSRVIAQSFHWIQWLGMNFEWNLLQLHEIVCIKLSISILVCYCFNFVVSMHNIDVCGGEYRKSGLWFALLRREHGEPWFSPIHGLKNARVSFTIVFSDVNFRYKLMQYLLISI